MVVNLTVYDVLDRLYADLDDEYGNPDGDPTTVPNDVRAKAEELAALINATYVPWMCEPTGRRATVNVKRWLAGNRNIEFKEATT